MLIDLGTPMDLSFIRKGELGVERSEAGGRRKRGLVFTVIFFVMISLVAFLK